MTTPITPEIMAVIEKSALMNSLYKTRETLKDYLEGCRILRDK